MIPRHALEDVLALLQPQVYVCILVLNLVLVDKLYVVLVYCCTMLCTGVLYMLSHELCSVPVQPPIFKMYTSEILYETESSFEIMLSELKIGGK